MRVRQACHFVLVNIIYHSFASLEQTICMHCNYKCRVNGHAALDTRVLQSITIHCNRRNDFQLEKSRKAISTIARRSRTVQNSGGPSIMAYD